MSHIIRRIHVARSRHMNPSYALDIVQEKNANMFTVWIAV